MASAEEARKKQSFGNFLYEYIDSIWFKGEQTWVFCSSFLAKSIHCTPDQAKDLFYLTSFHQEYCDKVSNWYPSCEPLSAGECREKGVPYTEWRPEDYHLLPIFRRLLIIIEEVPTDVPPYFLSKMPIAMARLVFTEDQKGRMEIDPISVPDLCAKYNVMTTDDPNVVMGKLSTVLEIVISLWEQERPKLTYLDPIVDRLQERLKFKVQDIEAFSRGLHEKENARANNN